MCNLQLKKEVFMKKIILISGLFLFLMGPLCYAHSPSSIDANYDDTKGILNVTVMHPVNNPNNHYVEKVEIVHNNNMMIEQNFNLQSNENSQKIIYMVPGVEKGDTISVEAYCNRAGEIEEEIEIK